MSNSKFFLSVIYLLLPSIHSNLLAQERPPNIVYILIDDLGWKDLGCYGSEFYETPNIDKLRAQGMKFTAAYSASPVCSPSRASILTGKNPANIGFTGHITAIGKHRYPEEGRIIPPDDYMHVSLEEKMIPEILLQSGYTSASIGKWHVGEEEKYFPTNQGFAINIAGYEHGSPPTYWGPFESEKSWNPVIKNLDNREEGQYLTNRLTDEAINFIDKNKEGPFFLYLSHYAVHTPLEAPDSLVNKYELKLEGQKEQKNAIYAAMIENMDWNFGRLLKSLDSLGLDKNTIVILGSDNGGEGRVTNNAPLREGKGYIYEGGIRVTLVIKWPGNV
ncbi:sulfatase, partial [uncultured Cyclobacterium sp.]|uniref:sulfatase n=1 Tax=uncultured Cyclobacterium sp. TaxID=453820 RepID=UPI0030EE11D6